MTNEEFIKEYGKRELIDITKSTYLRLSILKINKKIGSFRVDNKRKQVQFYQGKNKFVYDIAKIYSIQDNELLSLLKNRIGD